MNRSSSWIGRAIGLALLFTAVLGPGKATASSVFYQFDTPFPSDPSPAGAGPWIDAAFQDVIGGVLLTVTNVQFAAGEFVAGNGSGANGGLFFNLNPNYNPNGLSFSLVAANGSFGTTIGTGANSFKADGDGKYDMVFDFTANTFTANSFFTYLISGISGLTAGRDLSFVTVTVADKAGLTAPRADNRIRFDLEGPGEIVATDNGDPTSFESFQSHDRKAFNGLCLVIVRGKAGQPGEVKLTAKADGLKTGTAFIKTKWDQD